MSFNDEAVQIVFDKVVSYALSTGRFDHVNQHEPKNAPGAGTVCSIWAQSVKPYKLSGMGAISGTLLLQARIYKNFRSEPFDMIDPDIVSAASDIMGAICGDFDFGGDADVRAVDLLGMAGTPLSSQAGYVEVDRQMFRVMTIAIPIIINDMFIVEALW